MSERRATFEAASIGVVHRDEDLLVLDKPSGLPTTSSNGSPCLALLARELDPSAPRLHPSSRLDAEVTGLVTFARTERATRALLDARRRGEYRRFYLGLASQALSPEQGELRFAIAVDRHNPRFRVALPEGAKDKDAEPACTRYELLRELPQAALLLLRPQTGRTHQLRVHLAHAGAPLLGDRHYGGLVRRVLPDGHVLSARRVMLHCTALVLPAIRGQGTLVLRAQAPDDFSSLYTALGGDAAHLRLAETLVPP